MQSTADIIEGFGGTSAIVRAINLAESSLRPKGRTATVEMVCNWRARARINQDWYPAILEAAKVAGVALSADDLIALNVTRPAASDEGQAA